LDSAIDTVVFDLGGVLIDWNPYHLYRELLPDDRAIGDFIEEIDLYGFLHGVDADKPFEASVRELAGRHPHHADLIHAYWDRWPETLNGALDDTVTLVRELKARAVPLYVVSNWSGETWHHGAGFPFLDHFDGLVISGLEGIAKPDARIYRILLDRHGLAAGTCLFVDDRRENVEAAERLGFHGHLFDGAAALRQRLQDTGLLS
jgi:2-haloacid dehalogenase